MIGRHILSGSTFFWGQTNGTPDEWVFDVWSMMILYFLLGCKSVWKNSSPIKTRISSGMRWFGVTHMKRCWGNHPFRAKELPSHLFSPFLRWPVSFCGVSFRFMPTIDISISSWFPNSNSFGVFSQRFRGRITFGLSRILWGRSVLLCQKLPRKVPPRFKQGSTKVLQVSWSPWSSGADPFLACQKVLWKVPPSLL